MRIIFNLLSFLFSFFIFVSNVSAVACCSNAECGGQTCAGVVQPCPPTIGSSGAYGSCTLGGAECGPGVGAQCPANYTCLSGSCCPSGWVQNGQCVQPGGGSSCPAECRAGSSCGSGYQSASGCSGSGPNFGCNSNQVCCKANSCGSGGSGTGGCPAGQVATYYNPPQYFCPNPGTPVPPNRYKEPQEVCGQTANGNDKITVERGYCAPPPCTSTPPTAPSLVSPANPPTPAPVASTSVPLSWSPSASWGTSCTTTNRRYGVYVGTVNDKTLVRQIAWVSDPGTSTTFQAMNVSAVGNTATVSFNNNFNTTTDWIGLFEPGAANNSYLAWKYLNNTQTVPGAPVYSGSVTLTLPIADIHKYEIRHIRAGVVIDYAYINPEDNRIFYWVVWAHNGEAWSPSSQVYSFVIVQNQVAGNVYDDPTGTCSTSTPANVGGALGVTWGTDSASVASDGSFLISTSGASPQNLSLTGMPAGYICSPGCGSCPTKSGVVSPSTNNNFFLTSSRNSWWQSIGAGVYAGQTGGGQTISSNLPSSSTNLVIPGTNDLAAIVRSSGTIGTGAGQISSNRWNAVSTYSGKKMDYIFFSKNMGVTNSTANDWVSDSITKPVYSASRDFYYHNPVGVQATIDSPWSVTSSEKYVIFVDGDLRINANITVANGGFLAIVVNGGVTVASSVTSVQGILVMDDVFTTESHPTLDDSQLSIEGMVVTWSGVSLLRDLGSSNVTTPAERFTYRPDLLVNMPAKMKTFALEWQEVAPGSFE